MNFMESLVSDEDDDGHSVLPHLQKGTTNASKFHSLQSCVTVDEERNLETSSESEYCEDMDEDENEDELPSQGKNLRQLQDRFNNEGNVLKTRKRKISSLNNLAKIGSQRSRPSKPKRTSKSSAVTSCDRSNRDVQTHFDELYDTEDDIDRNAIDLDCSQEALQFSNDDDKITPLYDETVSAKGDDSLLDKLLSRQSSMIEEFFVPIPVKTRKKTKSEILKSAVGSLTISEFWDIELDFLAPDFFPSKEAKMEVTDKVKKGVRAFEGLRINHENSHDMKSVYEVDFLPSMRVEQKPTTYEQFKVTVGQYARMCVTLKKCNVKTLCQPGNLFRAICNRKLAEAFLGYFHIRASPATVAQKANTLVKLADNADFFFRVKNPALSAKAQATGQFIRRTSSTHKKLTRQKSRQNKDLENRFDEGSLFTEADFIFFGKRSGHVLKQCLPSIKKYVVEYEAAQNAIDGASQSPIIYERQIVSLVNKWCINFLCFLMMTGAGQRPQVYSELILPTRTELKKLQEEARTNGYFELATVHEKTSRAIDAPYVIFTSSAFRYFAFHVRYVRDIIVRLTAIDESSIAQKTLLLHTNSGYRLDSGNVTRTLQRFISLIDPERAPVNTMMLRASYATIMLQKYREGQILSHKTEGQFLEYLAKVMNTSVQQLSTTYASSSREAFASCAREVAKIMDSNMEHECDVFQ